MITCRECGHQEFAGALFCSECGASLLELGGEVAVLDAPRAPKPPPLLGQTVSHTRNLPRLLVAFLPLTSKRVTLPLEAGEILVGRATADQENPPALDLTPHHGAELGVSRIHAAIQITEQGITIIDLNSTNGTFINNFRLPPELPYPIQNGDELQFGSLLIHIFLLEK